MSTFEALIDDGIAAHAAACATVGLDPGTDLVTGRVVHGRGREHQAAHRLLGLDDTARMVDLIIAVTAGEWPAHVWALTYQAAFPLQDTDVNARVVIGDMIQADDCPPEVLAQAARNPRAGWRMIVALQPNTPGDALAVLAADRLSMVRRQVAENARTPKPVRALLARDPDPEVRARLNTRGRS